MNKEVTLNEILDARENRANAQREIINKYKSTLISLTLNIPGSLKVFPLSIKTYNEAIKLIKTALKGNGINIIYEAETLEKTGYEGFFAADENPVKIKKLMVHIENSCKLGRIFDIDVLDNKGCKISRSDLNLSERNCFVCDDFGHVCARSRKHTKEELHNSVIKIMKEYFNKQFADQCAACACRALLYEVCITPKPGLVDRNNNGSHMDMDIFTFIDSTAVLIPYFRDLVLTVINLNIENPKEIFEKIRYYGMLAENNMFLATNNVNTHKGLIFSLGVICASLGYLYCYDKAIDIVSILDVSKEMTLNINHDFTNVTKDNAKTFGEKQYANYGITGIRGEAASGFSSVINYGLPVLTKLIKKGYSLNDASALTLINLIANVKDTNIVARSSIETLNDVQSHIRKLIDNKGIENININEIINLDIQFIEKNISPGGCADLLAVTLMLYFVDVLK